MIKESTLNLLKDSKNLLAFSAGVDSSALFFILLEHNINFDIAIVNYGLREQAKQEVSYAKELADRYSKKIFIANAPKFNSNFEANARDFRYNFFTKTINEHNYNTLLTAHQLNDKLEWLLMQLSTGAGVVELSGMQEISNNKGYKIVRPLLGYTKEELLVYLDSNKHKYFIDESNSDEKYRRNQFRPVSNALLEFGKSGFNKSFEILEYEANNLKHSYRLLLKEKELRVLKLENRAILPYATSYTLKELGYLLSGKERDLLKVQDSLVAGRKWAVEYLNGLLYIAPYTQSTIPKDKKEQYRKAKIPAKIRGYIFEEEISIANLMAPLIPLS